MEVAKIASSLWMILVYISTKGISLQYWENPDLENILDDEEYEIAADAFDEWLDEQEFGEEEDL